MLLKKSMPDRYSWFVAALPPPQITAEVASAVFPLKHAHPGVVWLPRKAWHVTVAFCGVGTATDGVRIGEVVAGAATSRGAWRGLRMVGSGVFGDHVWCGVSTTEDVTEWVTNLHDVLRAEGFPVPVRRWHPHMSVGRAVGAAGVVKELSLFSGSFFDVTTLFVLRGPRVGEGFFRAAAVPLG